MVDKSLAHKVYKTPICG